MKSHLIPEPGPLDQNLYSNASARVSRLSQMLSNGAPLERRDTDRADDIQKAPDMPMRNFLRVVFVR